MNSVFKYIPSIANEVFDYIPSIGILPSMAAVRTGRRRGGGAGVCRERRTESLMGPVRQRVLLHLCLLGLRVDQLRLLLDQLRLLRHCLIVGLSRLRTRPLPARTCIAYLRHRPLCAIGSCLSDIRNSPPLPTPKAPSLPPSPPPPLCDCVGMCGVG